MPELEPEEEANVVGYAGVALKVPDGDPRWAGREMPELFSAAKACDLARLASVLDLGHDIDEADASAGGETALHIAAEEGHSEAVALLLDRGASIEAASSEGWRPLHSAAQSEAAGSADTVAAAAGARRRPARGAA